MDLFLISPPRTHNFHQKLVCEIDGMMSLVKKTCSVKVAFSKICIGNSYDICEYNIDFNVNRCGQYSQREVCKMYVKSNISNNLVPKMER